MLSVSSNARSGKTKKGPRPKTTMLLNRPSSGVWNAVDQKIPHFERNYSMDNKVHNVVQMTNLTTVITGNVSVPQFLGLSFNASTHVSQFSSWATVFDQYRIMEIELWLVPAVQGIGTTNTGTQSLYSVIDYDDAATPGSTSQLLQYSNVIVSPASNGHYRRWRPHIAVAAYQGSFAGYKNEKSNWIDVASGTVAHYGVKVGLEAGATTNIQAFIRIWVQFRNVF